MKPLGKAYADATANTGDFQRLPAGGYIAKILAVKDVDDKSYLLVTFDIAEGEKKGFYAKTDAEHEYTHQFIRSYKETALGMFKGFLKAVDNSNGTNFEPQAEKGFAEQQLVGKVVGILVGYEEYVSNRGDVRERMRVNTRSAETIRSGNFTVPELKKLETGNGGAGTVPVSPVAGFEGITDADIPF